MVTSNTSLLIGATGLIGRHLAGYLNDCGEKIIGTYFDYQPDDRELRAKVRYVQCDVRQKKSLESLVAKYRPRDIYFLSAQSSVRESWFDPVNTMNINFMAGLHLLEYLRKKKIKCCVMFFSSGTTYGDSFSAGRPLNEDAAQKPKDPYSVSKVAIDTLARLYAKVYGLDAKVVRLANIMGPGQSPTFSVANFARQLANIKAGRQPRVIQVGSISSWRDYLDVRDAVRAIRLVMKKGKPGQAYHVSSGKSRKLSDVLKQIIKCAGFSEKQIKVINNSSLMSKDEIQAVRLNPQKLKSLTGWKPEVSFQKSLMDILNNAEREAV